MITNNTRGGGSRSIEANVGRFVGPCGSVRQIVKHEYLPVIACVGLDRMLRTYDINSRKQLDCVYLKQRLNCMLFCEDVTWSNEEENVDQESFDDGEYEDMDMFEGNIDDDDVVADYIDSSEEEGVEGDDDNDQGIDSIHSDEDGGDGRESSSADEDLTENVYQNQTAKRRKR